MKLNFLLHAKYLVLYINLFLAVLFLSACSTFHKTTIPIETINYVVGAGSTKTLLVLLPGIRDNDKSFAKNDFISILDQNNIDIDVIAVNLHFAYYKNKNLIDRIEQDVIHAARQQGYENIWLLGISLGGLGAMFYTNQLPDNIQGVILLAPYLGDKDLIEEIKNYPSLEEWSKFAKQKTKDKNKGKASEMESKIEKYIWVPLAERECYPLKPIYLMYGENDKHQYSNEVLASCLSKDRVIRIQGKHNWNTWKALWNNLLNKNPNIFTPQ